MLEVGVKVTEPDAAKRKNEERRGEGKRLTKAKTRKTAEKRRKNRRDQVFLLTISIKLHNFSSSEREREK